MSYTTVQPTNMNNRDLLVDGLKSLGYKPEVDEAGRKIRGDRTETSRQYCQVILEKETTGLKADIGFSQAGSGMFDVVTDTFVNNSSVLKLPDFVSKVKVAYQKAFAKQKARKAGATFLGERTMPDGSLKLQFRVNA